ncbi:hypothetical protein ACHAXT_001000 [Thalassiosira profunda]
MIVGALLVFLPPVCSGFASLGSLISTTTILAKPNLDADINIIDHATLSSTDAWEEYYTGPGTGEPAERRYRSPSHSYVSHLLRDMNDGQLQEFLDGCAAHSTKSQNGNEQAPDSYIDEQTTSQSTEGQKGKMQTAPDTYIDEPYRHLRLLRRRLPDPLWSQIKLEAQHTLSIEPDCGPQLYEFVIRQPSLMDALGSIISHEIETELVPATALQALVLDQLQLIDDKSIHLDLVASVNRKPSDDSTALNALMFHQGLHALVCYRVAHRLWQAGRTGLAYYLQSTVSAKYAADIHPAAEIEGGIYLNVGGGVVIGETARVGPDVTILQGVTLGGTGKEVGDRHPKVEEGVILHCGATVLGNLRVGKGAVVTAKSIVTKEVPDLARVSGVPATVKSYRELREEGFDEDDEEEEEDDDSEEDCDLDCKMSKLYDSYFAQLQSLSEVELCLDSGGDCWDMMVGLLFGINTTMDVVATTNPTLPAIFAAIHDFSFRYVPPA